MIKSACGLVCNECAFFNKECKGCFMVKGKPFWTARVTEKGICPLFDCSIIKKGLSNCGDCIDLPCQMFIDLKDPNVSDYEHQKSIRKRISNLRN